MSKKPFATRAGEPRTSWAVRSGAVQVSQDIMPAAELKAKLGDVLRSLDQRRPIVLTLNGKAAGVLMSPEEFDRLSYAQSVRSRISQGLADVEAGRLTDGEQIFDELAVELDRAQAERKRSRKR